MQELAQRISKLMSEQSISTQMLAKDLHLSYSALNNYLHARRWPDLATLRHIACRLHTSTDYLLGLSDAPHENDPAKTDRKFTDTLQMPADAYAKDFL